MNAESANSASRLESIQILEDLLDERVFESQARDTRLAIVLNFLDELVYLDEFWSKFGSTEWQADNKADIVRHIAHSETMASAKVRTSFSESVCSLLTLFIASPLVTDNDPTVSVCMCELARCAPHVFIGSFPELLLWAIKGPTGSRIGACAASLSFAIGDGRLSYDRAKLAVATLGAEGASLRLALAKVFAEAVNYCLNHRTADDSMLVGPDATNSVTQHGGAELVLEKRNRLIRYELFDSGSYAVGRVSQLNELLRDLNCALGGLASAYVAVPTYGDVWIKKASLQTTDAAIRVISPSMVTEHLRSCRSLSVISTDHMLSGQTGEIVIAPIANTDSRDDEPLACLVLEIGIGSFSVDQLMFAALSTRAFRQALPYVREAEQRIVGQLLMIPNMYTNLAVHRVPDNPPGLTGPVASGQQSSSAEIRTWAAELLKWKERVVGDLDELSQLHSLLDSPTELIPVAQLKTSSAWLPLRRFSQEEISRIDHSFNDHDSDGLFVFSHGIRLILSQLTENALRGSGQVQVEMCLEDAEVWNKLFGEQHRLSVECRYLYCRIENTTETFAEDCRAILARGGNVIPFPGTAAKTVHVERVGVQSCDRSWARRRLGNVISVGDGRRDSDRDRS